jgi:hypothetical protein
MVTPARSTTLPAPLAVILAPVFTTLVATVNVAPLVASSSPVLVMPPPLRSNWLDWLALAIALASMIPVVALTTANPLLPMTPAPWMVPALVSVRPPEACWM